MKVLPVLSVSTHSDLTPDTVQARQALVTLDASVTAVALGGGVTLDPNVLHSLEGRRGKKGSAFCSYSFFSCF